MYFVVFVFVKGHKSAKGHIPCATCLNLNLEEINGFTAKLASVMIRNFRTLAISDMKYWNVSDYIRGWVVVEA